MKISSKTKISALIKENPKAIDAIASINSHFEKLRNPVLRKILASRVTIADAARIGGADIAVFFDKLGPLGFEPENDSVSATKMPDTTLTVTPRPSDLPENLEMLDVREDLATGNDPFNQIMDALEDLEKNQGLLLINTFEPTPLLSIVKKRGFAHYTEQKSPDLVHTYLYRSTEPDAEPAPVKTELKPTETALPFPQVLQKFKNNLQEVDVREMEMPLPMVTILETLPKLAGNEALLVHHRRVPQYLLPQLAERGFAYATNELGPDQVQLLIYKN